MVFTIGKVFVPIRIHVASLRIHVKQATCLNCSGSLQYTQSFLSIDATTLGTL